MTDEPDDVDDLDPRRVPDLCVGELDEIEIFAAAPVFLADRVHWESPDDFDPARVIPDLPMRAWTRRWSDGQCRVWVEAGQGHAARDAIRQWCEEREIEVFNARVEAEVPFRDLELIDPDLLGRLMAAAVDWLYPRTGTIRRRLVADLDLVEDDDVRSMMFLFVSDVTDRYDSGREGRLGRINYLAYLLGKIRTWPQDLARSTYGRIAVADRQRRMHAVEAFTAEHHRNPTEGELADLLGISVTDLRAREETLTTLAGLRNTAALIGPDDQEERVFIDEDVIEQTALDYDRDAVLTRAIIAAVHDGPKGPDPLGLASLYLTYWEGMSRADAARHLEVLPKTVTAAVNRVTGRIDTRNLDAHSEE